MPGVSEEQQGGPRGWSRVSRALWAVGEGLGFSSECGGSCGGPEQRREASGFGSSQPFSGHCGRTSRGLGLKTGDQGGSGCKEIQVL